MFDTKISEVLIDDLIHSTPDINYTLARGGSKIRAGKGSDLDGTLLPGRHVWTKAIKGNTGVAIGHNPEADNDMPWWVGVGEVHHQSGNFKSRKAVTERRFKHFNEATDAFRRAWNGLI